MYNHLDSSNIDLSSGYPEHEAVYNADKHELTAFHNGMITDTWQAVASEEQAESIYDAFIAQLEEAGEV